MLPTLKLDDGFAHSTPEYKDEVRLLQRHLVSLGHQVPGSGEFDRTVQQAVMHFQRANGLLATGVVDANTWNRLLGPQETVPAPSRIFKTAYARQDAALLQQLKALQMYAADVRTVAARYGIPSAVIAGMGSRESHWGLALSPPGPDGTANRGHGRGLLQIDDRWHPDFIQSGLWSIPLENIRYGCALLRSFMGIFVERYNWSPGQQTLRAALAGYNCGPRRVYEAWQTGNDLDHFTAGRNYSADVLSRASWFQLYGWN